MSGSSSISNVRIVYLRKLGWPGVCEFGAGVPLGSPWPFVEGTFSVEALIVEDNALNGVEGC
jgi:hypothetical protein